MAADDKTASKHTKFSQAEMPNHPLQAALRVAQGLYDQFAGGATAPHDVALAIDVSPTSSAWRVLSGAAIAYGLTSGGYNSPTIALTDLARRIVAPVEEGDDAKALVDAAVKPRILREFFSKYDRAKFPRDDIAQNVLASMGVPKDRTAKALDIIKANGRFVGLIRDTKTGPFVAISNVGSAGTSAIAPAAANDPDELETLEGVSESTVPPAPLATAQPAAPTVPKQIFVAHGKNHQPLEALKKILDQFKIPYKVAVDEPNAGRPISRKVAQLMRECSAGIFIFTGDEKFVDAEGVEIYRPSENVVYELGAASVLWENKIVILKQADVTFPSDYKDLGYIEFEANNLGNHALDLLKELIALDFVRVQAA